MASELELRWLKANDFKGAAKRFAVFCKEDIKVQADSEQFSSDVYQDAIKLVLSKLDRSLTLVELTNRIAAEEEAQESDLDFSLDDGEDTDSNLDEGIDTDDDIDTHDTDSEDIITEGRHHAD